MGGNSRKIVFAHGRAPGDILMMTAGVREFKALFPDIKVNVECKFPELWENNPHLDRSITRNDPGVEHYNVGYPHIQNSNEGFIHFTFSFLLDMISQVDAVHRLPISLGEFAAALCGGGEKDFAEGGEHAHEPFITWRKKYGNITKESFRQWGDIYLTDQEKAYDGIKDIFGVENYWIIAPGGKRDCTTKIWDWRKFQRVVDHFDGLIKFVCIGRSDHLIEPLRGTINFVDKTPNLRDLFPLFYHATGVVTGVSFPMHLAAAMPANREGPRRKPCVVFYGGREPVSFTAYCNHQILHTNGAIKCCGSGGCWQSRVTEIAKDPEQNKRMCHKTVEVDGRTIQHCMDMISAEDVIRAIEKYYDGGLYQYSKPQRERIQIVRPLNTEIKVKDGIKKEMNMLASMQSSGGGEQSAQMIATVLRKDGWTVHFHPWDMVDGRFKDFPMESLSFKNGMAAGMAEGLPLLFYANDQVGDFCDENQMGEVIGKSSAVIVGINYMNGKLPRCAWLSKSGKIKSIVFQNREKLEEFRRDAVGFDSVNLIPLFGAIDLDRLYEIPQARRKDNEPLVVLKHCKADFRKYVTSKSAGNGEKIHEWQKYSSKEEDKKFYARLLADCKFPIRFEFMEAHEELIAAFPDEPRMVFHKWDAMPVNDFLKRGHIYLYRTSNMWRDQYPRCVAEALAAGIPVLTEPRDGTADRVVFGDTGFYCMDYDQFLDSIKKLHRKEDYRYHMGYNAKEWAKKNLNPSRWIDVIEGAINGN